MNSESKVDVGGSEAGLARKLTALSYTLTSDELDQLGGLLAASGATVERPESFRGDVSAGHKPFLLDTSKLEKIDSCW